LIVHCGASKCERHPGRRADPHVVPAASRAPSIGYNRTREEDDVLAEIYAVKKRIAEECDCDFDKLLAQYKRMQEKSPEVLMSEVPKTDSEPRKTCSVVRGVVPP
jgi:hypothetical protein